MGDRNGIGNPCLLRDAVLSILFARMTLAGLLGVERGGNNTQSAFNMAGIRPRVGPLPGTKNEYILYERLNRCVSCRLCGDAVAGAEGRKSVWR